MEQNVLTKRNRLGSKPKLSEIGPGSFRAQMLAVPTKHRPTRADERATSRRRAGDEQATSFGHRGPGLDQAVYREQNRRRHMFTESESDSESFQTFLTVPLGCIMANQMARTCLSC